MLLNGFLWKVFKMFLQNVYFWSLWCFHSVSYLAFKVWFVGWVQITNMAVESESQLGMRAGFLAEGSLCSSWMLFLSLVYLSSLSHGALIWCFPCFSPGGDAALLRYPGLQTTASHVPLAVPLHLVFGICPCWSHSNALIITWDLNRLPRLLSVCLSVCPLPICSH